MSFASPKDRIGFIGLGLMGRGIATNILAKGWPLTVLAHRNREAVDALVEKGATEASSLAELAAQSDVVILCVTGSTEVAQILEDPNGMIAASGPKFIVDCSTSDPAQTLQHAARLESLGITLVDAPLGRTPKEAEAGTLDVMVGGQDNVVEQLQPLLNAFAGRVVHTGPVGTGHTMKLLNNFLSMGYAALYSEALALGAKANIKPDVFDAVIRNGRMDCGFYKTFMAYVLDRDPNAHKFYLSNALKDMSYLAAFANAKGFSNPLGAAVRNLYAMSVATGHGGDFVPTLSDLVANWNGTSLVD